MQGLNKVMIIGTLGDDPAIRYTQSGLCCANISVATNERWKDKQTGEKKESTEWHKVCMFGRTAEIAQEYLRKGSQVFVEGKLQTRKWEDKEGNTRYTTEINAHRMLMLSGKGGQQKPQDTNIDRGAADPEFDDEIPF